ncbi:alcohol dehydrogenase 2-like isoform X2 [Wyeomyia smithii]|uniref:alcohol dehydrogenase 2-like isoform X2 n=1 Tax=Wyeomyia smithii TaxID=174621 RepID=UPI002467AC4B|nr:alcohol dehydrogenase 2-like isoform X2 [Wyeomyia smithii]
MGYQKILLIDLNESLNPDLKAQLNACNQNAEIFYAQCDVSNKLQLEKILRQDAIQWLGSIDILVNSAGVLEGSAAHCIGVNLIGLIECTFITIDLMTKEKSGTGGFIVNISSIAGLEPYPIAVVYTASKFGVTGFTRSLGTDLLYNRTGVKLAVVCPGATETKMIQEAGDHMCTYPWMMPAARELLAKFTMQQPSAVGKCVVKAITEGETGSIWVASEDKIIPIQTEQCKFKF